MIPPFSRSPRMGDKKVLETGARHVEQALMLLKVGGRLVAIVGRGMGPTPSSGGPSASASNRILPSVLMSGSAASATRSTAPRLTIACW